MEGDRIEMSRWELNVLKVMEPVMRGRRTQGEAARLLELSVRQVRRIQRRLEAEEDRGVVHRLRGRPSNRRVGAQRRRQVIEMYRGKYEGFGPTMASEKLPGAGSACGGGDVASVVDRGGVMEAVPEAGETPEPSAAERVFRGDGAGRWVAPRLAGGAWSGDGVVGDD